MKLCRFLSEHLRTPTFGLIEGDLVLPYPFGETIGTLSAPNAAENQSIDTIQLVAPITPSKIVCVGRNYVEHAAELGNKMPDEPLLFLKAPSAVVGHEQAIELPGQSRQVEHEGELGVVIGREAKHIGPDENPLDYVLGYTCVNDVTARDLQRRDVQFTRGKSFDTFCPVGPHIVTGISPIDLAVTTKLNGELKQHARTSSMAFP